MPLPPTRRLRAGLAALWLGCAAVSAASAAADSPLPAAVAEALRRAKLPADALAAVVLPLAGAGPQWQRQPDRAMQPASTMKLVTSIVALDRLGPDARGFTELLTLAPQQGELLAGDLVLRGGADPELGLAQLWALLAELRWQGIREIGGDIVLDRTLFRAAPAVPAAAGEAAAPPFDAWPEFAYNGVPDALQLNSNLMGVELRSDDPARPGVTLARPLPPLPGLELDASALRPSERACRDWGEDWVSPPLLDRPGPGRLRIALRGAFPRGCNLRVGLALLASPALAELHLRMVWEGLGGRWSGRVREATAPLVPPLTAAAQAAAAAAPPPGAPPANWLAPGVALAGVAPGPATPNGPTASAAAGTTADPAQPAAPRLLARRFARPWGELLRHTNKQSDNPSSRLLYLSLGLGAMADEPGATTADLAARAVQDWLAEHRIAGAGLVLDNGSGLSRSERASPRQLAAMLQVAMAGRWAPELLMSLPLAGVDGTLRRRFTTGPATGRARLKGGTLKNAVALAGLVADAQGRWWALAAILNHEQAAAGRPALDALVDWVAAGGMGPQAGAAMPQGGGMALPFSLPAERR